MLERVNLLAPVTALRYFQVDKLAILFIGQGPFLKILDAETGSQISTRKIFETQAIHGIVVQAIESPSIVVYDSAGSSHSPKSCYLFVWGGSLFKIIKFSFTANHGTPLITRVTSSHEGKVSDWILDASFSDVKTNDHITSSVAMITSHNVLLLQEFQNLSGTSISSRPVRKLGSIMKSMLYSAHLIWQHLDKKIIVAAGTVFGKIIVWSYKAYQGSQNSNIDSCARIHYEFTEHQGSIFGVEISPQLEFEGGRRCRLLASCSDDRTIRIWDITDTLPNSEESFKLDVIEPVDTSLALKASNYDTGFSLNTERTDDSLPNQCLATAWGHKSRIWGIQFVKPIDQGYSPPFSLSIVSRGEDATWQLWRLDLSELAHGKSKIGIHHQQTYHCHSGKNIWSLEVFQEQIHSHLENPSTFTGGADGSVTCYSLPYLVRETRTNRCRFADIPEINTLSSGKSRPDPFKAYAFMKGRPGYIIATTDSGKIVESIQIPRTDSRFPVCGDQFNFSLIASKNDLKSHSVLASYPYPLKLAIIAGFDGKLTAFEAGLAIRELPSLDEKIESLFPFYSEDPFVFGFVATGLMKESNQANHQEQGEGQSCFMCFMSPSSLCATGILPNGIFSRKIQICLRENFRVTSALFVSSRETLLLGSRTGALACINPILADNLGQPNESLLEPQSYFPLIHDDAITAITNITPLKHPDKTSMWFLTTSRDSYYAIHYIQCEFAQTPILITLHIGKPSFGPSKWSIEGVALDNVSNSQLNSRDIILYGFQSKDFIVWNESKQQVIMKVDCGGLHRSWAYEYIARSTGGVNDIKGQLVWTQASTFNYYSHREAAQKIIRAGGHGREIKAVAVSHLKNLRGLSLIATGAEDTAIGLFEYKASSNGEARFECLRTLRQHTTGIQHLQWSSSGNYLFSSGGREEFYIWKIVRDIPGFGPGAVCEYPSRREITKNQKTRSQNQKEKEDRKKAKSKRGIKKGEERIERSKENEESKESRKHEENQESKKAEEGARPESSDLRITCFDVLDVRLGDENPEDPYFLLAMGLSDSSIRIFLFDNRPDQKKMIPIASGTYTTFCLTQLRFVLTQGTLYLCTASTDGCLVFWQLDNILTHYNFSIQQPGTTLSVSQLPDSSLSESLEILPSKIEKVHQNSIKSLDIIYSRSDSHNWLVITGGDDNALALTRISFFNTPIPAQNQTEQQKQPESDPSHNLKIGPENIKLKILRIPHAHASAVTALATGYLSPTAIKGTNCSFVGHHSLKKAAEYFWLVSTGNDQRMKSWIVEWEISEDGDIDAWKSKDEPTAIADAAGMDILNRECESDGPSRLIVCGIGMEAWNVGCVTRQDGGDGTGGGEEDEETGSILRKPGIEAKAD
ncbi:MAG: hypothetical protein M1834_003557 [Cirrosporium novae-zelandiae]|nr:MAG: hypothetical protein M1834_003557 [Cirrosporium novae-zelandiae]